MLWHFILVRAVRRVGVQTGAENLLLDFLSETDVRLGNGLVRPTLGDGAFSPLLRETADPLGG